MKDELYQLTEGQQVVTIISGAEAPKILNVTMRNGMAFDRDFTPYGEMYRHDPKNPPIDCFNGGSGLIPRNNVYDEPQLSAQINILERTIANLIDGDDLSREAYDEAYFRTSHKFVERPVSNASDSKKIMQQEALVQMASHYFKMHLSLAVLMDVQELSEEKYNEVYDKTRETYIKELSGIGK